MRTFRHFASRVSIIQNAPNKILLSYNIEEVRIKETPGFFSKGRVSKTRIFRLNADNLIDISWKPKHTKIMPLKQIALLKVNLLGEMWYSIILFVSKIIFPVIFQLKMKPTVFWDRPQGSQLMPPPVECNATRKSICSYLWSILKIKFGKTKT